MLEVLPENLITLAKACGFPLYVVGGTCRDFLSGLRSLKPDYDICGPVSAEDFIPVAEKCGFKICGVYKNTGTVKLRCGADEYEFSSFRSDKYVRGVHRPVKIYFTDDIMLDALRRDFKCNAVYYDICGGQFVDPLGGIPEIKAGVINTVAPSVKVFGEDGLRLLRLCRIAGQTGLEPSEECLKGAAENAYLIKDITAERVYAELNAILHADEKYGVKYGHYKGLKLACETGVADYILPELTAGRGMSQRKDFHSHDVLEHSLRCVMYSAGDIRLAALLHDIGKPYCKVTSGAYHKHEEEGERIAGEILARLKAPKRLTEETLRLIALHMYDYDLAAREAKVRRMISANKDIFFKLMELKQADYSACRDDLSEAPAVAKWRKIYSDMVAENVPFSLKELDVKGDTLIAEGIPAEKTGLVLKKLLLECAIAPRLNERDKLISAAKRIAREI
ncbi:MAG: HD domain-containing protein [Clostridia bacterium]|nr:HD domain-containing protein [Clostridia bacterium]